MMRVKPMLPSYVEEPPIGNTWVYESKYDGFRAFLHITKKGINLVSRNGKELNLFFPEIIEQAKTLEGPLDDMVPVTLDGELAVLTSPYRADFKSIQIRGRTSNTAKIKQLEKKLPVHYLLFDLLELHGKSQVHLSFIERKNSLYDLSRKLQLPTEVKPKTVTKWQYIPYSEDFRELWGQIQAEDGEGVVAKRKTSKWLEGKRTQEWLKIKNWKVDVFIVTAFDKQNGFFHVGLLKNATLISVGLFTNGMKTSEKEALITIMRKNKIAENDQFIKINPSICVELRFLEWYDKQIRHPQFVEFRFDVNWKDCTTRRSQYTEKHFLK